MKTYLSVDVGGTYLKSAVLSEEGSIIEGSMFSTESFSDASREKIVQAFIETVLTGLKFIHNRHMQLAGIGIATPGPFDYACGIPLMKHKFESVYGFHLRKAIQDKCSISPEIPFKFMHDANAALAGEMLQGYAQNYENAAAVTIGTGLGFTFSQNKQIQCSETGGPMISIFKRPYQDGILEDYVSKRGFLRIYSELSGKSKANGMQVSDIGQWADQGDEISIQTFMKVGNILATSIGEILEKQNIQCLLFGGQISRSFRHMAPTIKECLKKNHSLKTISAFKRIDDAALIGAIMNINLMKSEISC